MLETETGELVEKTLEHEGEKVREFYSTLPGPVLVGIEATGTFVPSSPDPVGAEDSPACKRWDRGLVVLISV
jgi:hypothetical protein